MARGGARGLVGEGVDEVAVGDHPHGAGAVEALVGQVGRVLAVRHDRVRQAADEQPPHVVQVRKGAFVRVAVVQGPDDAVAQTARQGQVFGEAGVRLHRMLEGVAAVEVVQPVQVEHLAIAAPRFQPLGGQVVVAQLQFDAAPGEGLFEQRSVRVAAVVQAQSFSRFPEECGFHRRFDLLLKDR